MSCKDEAQNQSGALQAQSRVSPSQVSGAELCRFPRCGRPLNRAHQCPRNHPQTDTGITQQVKAEVVGARLELEWGQREVGRALARGEQEGKKADPEQWDAFCKDVEAFYSLAQRQQELDTAQADLLAWAHDLLAADEAVVAQHAALQEAVELGVEHLEPAQLAAAVDQALALETAVGKKGGAGKRREQHGYYEVHHRVRKYTGKGVRMTTLALRFVDGHLDDQSKRTLAASEATIWGEINGRVTVLTPKRDGMLATWFTCSGHGGFVVVTDHEQPAWQDKRCLSQDDWSGQLAPNQFYVYRFEEDCDWAIFEAPQFEGVMRQRWEGWNDANTNNLLWSGPHNLHVAALAATGDPTGEGYQHLRRREWESIVRSLLRYGPQHLPEKFAVGQVELDPAVRQVLEREANQDGESWGSGYRGREEETTTADMVLARLLRAHQAGAWGNVDSKIAADNERLLAAGGGELRSMRDLLHADDVEIVVTTSADRQTTRLTLDRNGSARKRLEQASRVLQDVNVVMRGITPAQGAACEPLLREALARTTDRPVVTQARQLLAQALEVQGKFDEAEPLYTELFQMAQGVTAAGGREDAEFELAVALARTLHGAGENWRARGYIEHARGMIAKSRSLGWYYGGDVAKLGRTIEEAVMEDARVAQQAAFEEV